MDNVTALCKRGQTLLSGDNRTLAATGQSPEGAETEFLDQSPPSYGSNNVRSNRKVLAQLVRNTSGITLLAKHVVKWKTAYRGKQVDGYCAVDHEAVAGIVDDWLPTSGVPNNDLFWLIKKGPCLVLTPVAGDATNVVAAGAKMTALTATTSQVSTAGKLRAFGTTTNVTNAVSIAMNVVAVAMSAKTTAETNEDLLIDLIIQS